MRKIFTSILCIFLLQAHKTNAQITLDHVVNPTQIGSLFYPVKISDNETKYFMMDTTSNTFDLMNLDFTPFMENIAVPVTVYPDYSIMYITRSLFDCDSANIEFMLENPIDANNTFYIMRTDGTILFEKDSVFGPYCYGCMGGSDLIKPIINTEEGAKMFLAGYDGQFNQRIEIYSLCGQVPWGIFDLALADQSLIKVYPNPASGSVTFELNMPGNMQDYELAIYNNNAQEIKRVKVPALTKEITVDVQSLSSGGYFYQLISKTKHYQPGKFVIAK